MTGYGRGDASSNGIRFSVEIQSTNRKQGDIAISIPKNLHSLEQPIRERLQAKITRGRLNVSIQMESIPGENSLSLINLSFAQECLASIQHLQKQLSISGEVTIDTLLRIPGLLQSNGPSIDPETYWPTIESALNSALSALLQMRKNEGLHLLNDLTARLSTLNLLTQTIASRAPELLAHYRTQLLTRIQNAGVQIPIDDERITREVILFADRSDISEELTRLQSHFSQFSNILESNQPAGRTLEFLTQEISRELNTLSTKSCDAQISQNVVLAKAELEKIREQLLNIE